MYKHLLSHKAIGLECPITHICQECEKFCDTISNCMIISIPIKCLYPWQWQQKLICSSCRKWQNVKFEQNFGAIFRENGSFPDPGNSTVEFLMPKSSFTQKFVQGFAPVGKLFQTLNCWIVSPGGCILRMVPKQVRYRICWKWRIWNIITHVRSPMLNTTMSE